MEPRLIHKIVLSLQVSRSSNEHKITIYLALHHACRQGRPRIVSDLIEAGADLNLGDSDGGNCLDIAIDSYNERCVDAIIDSDHWKIALSNATISKVFQVLIYLSLTHPRMASTRRPCGN